MAQFNGTEPVLLESEDWWTSKSFWLIFAGAVVLLIAGICGTLWWNFQKAQETAEIQASLLKSIPPEEKLAVVTRHLSEPYAAAWTMRLAHDLYEVEKFEASAKAFDLVKTMNASEDQKSGALLGQAQALIALGKNEEAIALLVKVATGSQKSSYHALAQFSLAELYLNQKKLKEARQTLEDLLVTHPQSSFAAESRTLLASLP